MKGQKLLKVTSILMIIGGVIAAIVGVLALLGISALVALAESAEGAGLLYASSAIIIVSSVIEFIAGIKGVGACSAPQKAAACVKWGIIIAVLYIISMIILNSNIDKSLCSWFIFSFIFLPYFQTS